jgi:hypothetical protein
VPTAVIVLGATQLAAAAPQTALAAADPMLAIAPTGSDAARCTPTAPCRSLQRAFAVARPGQTVRLAAGTYEEQALSGDKRDDRDVIFEPAPGATVMFARRLRLTSAAHITLRNFSFAPGTIGSGITIDACNADITVENGRGRSFRIFEGNRQITFRGGSWGGYNVPSIEEDSIVGTNGSDGPTKSCANGLAPPSTGILLDGVTFHDSFWGATSRDAFGSTHPDCFQIQGYVDGLTIRNSTFVRCGDSFIGAFPDQGDIRNVLIEKNTFRELGNLSYFGMQFSGAGHPHACSNFTFRSNIYWPNNPTSVSAYPPIRTACTGFVVQDNIFQRGWESGLCRHLRDEFATQYANNIFAEGSCGTTTTVPWGYEIAEGRLRPITSRAAAIKSAFRLAAAGTRPAVIARDLNKSRQPAPGSGRWRADKVKSIVANRLYTGGVYGGPAGHPALVARATWNRAQARSGAEG